MNRNITIRSRLSRLLKKVPGNYRRTLGKSNPEKRVKAEVPVDLDKNKLEGTFPYCALTDGKIYLQSANTNPGSMQVRIGHQAFQFEQITSNAPSVGEKNLLKYDGAITSDHIISDTNENYAAGVYFSPEWSLADKSTSYLTFSGDIESTEFFYTQDGQKFIAVRNSDYQFEGLFAAHRATAAVNIRAYDRDKNELGTWSESFDQHYIGGTDLARYKKVVIQVPATIGAQFITVSIVYRGRAGSEPDVPAFLFFGNLRLGSIVEGSEKQPAPAGYGEWDPGLRQNTFVCAIDPRAFSRSDDTAILNWNGTESRMYMAPTAQIGLIFENNYNYKLKSSIVGDYTIYIDGKYESSIALGLEFTPFQISAAYLNGDIHHLMVRDANGMACYLEDFVVLPAVLTPYDVLQRETRVPYPSHLSHAARFRYNALQQHLKSAANGANDVNLKQVLHAHSVLEAGFETLTSFEPLTFTQPDNPDVSVVIPVHNKFAITYYCLCALLVAPNEVTFEVIVVDDGSTDETENFAEIVSGITVIKNQTAQRFLRACNRGAEAAKGKYITLLNNDTEAVSGWLDELVSAFERFENVGLAGSKLLYPDGTLQDAGGIVWNSGNPWNYGRGQNPWDPRYNYVRQADYVSGAAMMTTREIWDELGGLSSYLEPMYYEDTDFAFKVREAGYKSLFVPHSLVYHFEGKTSGTDTSSGMKRFQDVNGPKFKRRWASAFRQFGGEGISPDLEKDRGITGRVAFIDYATPRPDRDAGSYAAVQEMRLIQSLGMKVTFIPQNLAYFGDYTTELEKMGVETIFAPHCYSVNSFIEERGSEFDAFYLMRYDIAGGYIDSIRKYAPKAKILFNGADLHFLRQLRAGMLNNDRAAIATATEVRDQELDVMRKCDVTLSYNEVEHAVITSHLLDSSNVVKCPWVEKSAAEVPPFEARSGISFIGGFNHHPNAEGVTYFVENVMPLLNLTLPEVVFHIYGSAMTDAIRDLATTTIKPEGFVKDPSEAFQPHRISVAPLLSGAGIKGKVLSAIAHGIPCVLSPVAAEGIGLRNGYDCLIAKKPDDWAKAIKELYDNKDLWEEISANGRQLIDEQYSVERGRKLMQEAFEAAGIFV